MGGRCMRGVTVQTEQHAQSVPSPLSCIFRPQVYKTSQQAYEALHEKLGSFTRAILGDLK